MWEGNITEYIKKIILVNWISIIQKETKGGQFAKNAKGEVPTKEK